MNDQSILVAVLGWIGLSRLPSTEVDPYHHVYCFYIVCRYSGQRRIKVFHSLPLLQICIRLLIIDAIPKI